MPIKEGNTKLELC